MNSESGPRLVGAYSRVSSRAQNLATQRTAILRKSRALGDEIDTWFAEKKSAKTMQRPELDRVRQAAREGRLRRLYVFRIDRLTRSGIRDTFELVEELQRNGCEIVSVADGFELNSPAGPVILAVMAWAAEMERLATRERIAAARDRLEAEGRRWGRPPRLSEREIERASEMRVQGRTWRSIAMALRVPKSTVQRVVAASQKAHGPTGESETPDQPSAASQVGADQ